MKKITCGLNLVCENKLKSLGKPHTLLHYLKPKTLMINFPLCLNHDT